MDNKDLIITLDTSSLKPKEITDTEFKTDIYVNLQTILQKVFPLEFEKQRIKNTTTGLNFACPFCHDSAINAHKKRGHLLLNGRYAGRFRCFNCGKSMKMTTFFNEFDNPLNLNDITYIKNHVVTTENWYRPQNGNLTTAEVIDKDEVLKYALDRTYLRDILGLEEITQTGTPYAWNYLLNRCQSDFTKFLYSSKYKKIIILNLIDNDKVFGFQTRDLTGKAAAKYLTMSLTKMRENILHDFTPVPTYIENLSTVFNVFNVDIYKPILVTEGPFDAFLLPNCIATSGASKNLGIELPFWYVYDSDKTGLVHALDALKKGYKVFMWKKLKRDLCLPNRKKWDITDVMVWLKKQNMPLTIAWGNYFTSNPLDGLNL